MEGRLYRGTRCPVVSSRFQQNAGCTAETVVMIKIRPLRITNDARLDYICLDTYPKGCTYNVISFLAD